MLDVTGAACHACGELSAGKKFNRCARCKMVSYCSKDCKVRATCTPHTCPCTSTRRSIQMSGQMLTVFFMGMSGEELEIGAQSRVSIEP
jgi:hypothetical protein